MFNYLGHPYYDVGIATLAAFAGKRDPQLLTPQDLEKAADYMAREYVQQPLRSYLTVVFPNSGYNNPAFFKQPERQREYARRVLRSYSNNVPTLGEKCVFTGKPAVAVAFDDQGKLPFGRAFRQHIPLLTGEGAINFHPYGDRGLPVSGEALLAIQALPMGCAKSAGRLLLVHSDNPDVTLHFASEFLAENRRKVQVAQAASSKKMPESHRKHRTLLIETLLEAEDMQADSRANEESPFTVTAYHLSNSGQGPGLDIYFLPMQVVGFLRVMETAKFENAWHRIVLRAWEIEPPPKKRGQSKSEPEEPFQPARNWLYEDLFSLPDNARYFLRTYFLRIALRYARGKTDPRPNYSLAAESDLVSWAIAEQFLRRIMNMEPHRIAHIRKMADGLAEYVSHQNDRRFFREFYTSLRYGDLRTALVKADLAHVRQGNPPIIKFEPYIEVFEDGRELGRPDWRLARDLVLIRMIEKLHADGWLGRNAEVIEESADEENG